MSKHERTKSGSGGGGLLDMWFGRPKKTTNGGRPISAESDSLDDVQEQNNEMLSGEEINRRFIDILEDMNIPEDKRQPLLEKSSEEKLKMINMHYKGLYPYSDMQIPTRMEKKEYKERGRLNVFDEYILSVACCFDIMCVHLFVSKSTVFSTRSKNEMTKVDTKRSMH